MKKHDVIKTRYYSWRSGALPAGCRHCVQGRKLVLFVTGLCARRCYFCPISEQKKNRDVIYANERPITKLGDILEEARLSGAEGAGITGGDPLVKLQRTISCIRLLKKEFGRDFHIHLYLPLSIVTREKLRKLYDAGLDEIRAHPDLDKRGKWKKLLLLKAFSWDAGVEIPVIPGKEAQIKKLIDFISGKLDFINLNELEIAETQSESFRSRGLRCKDRRSYAISGSEGLGIRLLRYCAGKGLRAHYCPAKLKDRVQMAKRILNRARNVALPSDRITPDGTLVRGAIYLKETVPGFAYHNRQVPGRLRAELIRALASAQKKLGSQAGISTTQDKERLRLLASALTVKRHAMKIECLGLVPTIVEEYPTYDALLVDVQLLGRAYRKKIAESS